jgi:hypothetical protein
MYSFFSILYITQFQNFINIRITQIKKIKKIFLCDELNDFFWGDNFFV